MMRTLGNQRGPFDVPRGRHLKKGGGPSGGEQTLFNKKNIGQGSACAVPSPAGLVHAMPGPRGRQEGTHFVTKRALTPQGLSNRLGVTG